MFSGVEPQLDLSNQGNWDLVFSTHLRTKSQTMLRNLPIGTADLPVVLDTPVIAVHTESEQSPPHWRSAGWLNQRVRTGITVSDVSDAEYSDSHRLLLNRIKVFCLPNLKSYSLRFTAHNYLRDVALRVWRYTGEIKQGDIEQLDALRIDVLRIEKAVGFIADRDVRRRYDLEL
jgi:hypothetical protein